MNIKLAWLGITAATAISGIALNAQTNGLSPTVRIGPTNFPTTTPSAQTNGAALTVKLSPTNPPAASSAALTASAPTNVVLIRPDDETLAILRNSNGFKWINFATTILGGALATVGGILVTKYSLRRQAEQKRREDAEFRANVLSAIRCELEALGHIYENGIGAVCKDLKDGDVVQAKLTSTQDWFTVFNANAGHLGKFDAVISRQIVTVYALLKALSEEYKINNEYLDRREQLARQAGQHPFDQLVVTHRTITDGQLLDQATKIKQVDAAVKSSTAELYRLIEARQIK